jgi:hypothetical protein
MTSANNSRLSGSFLLLEDFRFAVFSDFTSAGKKYNSTSSLYVKDTINLPDIDDLTRCLALALEIHMKPLNYEGPGVAYDIFDEVIHPITYDHLSLDRVDAENIYVFVNTIFHVSELSPECAILTLAFLERIMTGKEGVILTPRTWRRTIMAIVILASKVWEEQAVWNADFLEHFPKVDIQDLNSQEAHLLKLLQWDVSCPGSLYAKYYFDLRRLSEVDDEHFPVQQLTDKDLTKLEARITFDRPAKVSDVKAQSKSFAPGDGQPKGKKVILN